MKRPGLSLIGTGFMGKCHALAYGTVGATFEGLPRPRLAVLCDVEAGHAAATAAAWGFERSVTDWRAVVADPDVDIVSITTPTAAHAEMAIAALAAGKHVHCEKPMAVTLADAERMAAAAAAAPGLTRLGYNYTSNPALAHAARLVADGTLGRLVPFGEEQRQLVWPLLPGPRPRPRLQRPQGDRGGGLPRRHRRYPRAGLRLRGGGEDRACHPRRRPLGRQRRLGDDLTAAARRRSRPAIPPLAAVRQAR